MRRIGAVKGFAFAAAFLSVVLAGGALLGATPGATTAERRLAIELRTRLKGKEIKAKDKVALDFALVYLRRAYLLDVKPAEVLAKELLTSGRRLKQADRLRYFGAALDALIRGAKLLDLRTALKEILESSYPPADKAFFLESLLNNATRYASPVPILKLAAEVSDNGLVGKRRRDFIGWALDEVGRGENPAYIRQMYAVVSEVSPSLVFQREFLQKCYSNGVRLGVPPRGLTDAITRIGKKYETARRLDEKVEELFKLYFDGTPFDDAVNVIAPPPKKEPGD